MCGDPEEWLQMKFLKCDHEPSESVSVGDRQAKQAKISIWKSYNGHIFLSTYWHLLGEKSNNHNCNVSQALSIFDIRFFFTHWEPGAQLDLQEDLTAVVRSYSAPICSHLPKGGEQRVQTLGIKKWIFQCDITQTRGVEPSRVYIRRHRPERDSNLCHHDAEDKARSRAGQSVSYYHTATCLLNRTLVMKCEHAVWVFTCIHP